jgi:hypothetical protein
VLQIFLTFWIFSLTHLLPRNLAVDQQECTGVRCDDALIGACQGKTEEPAVACLRAITFCGVGGLLSKQSHWAVVLPDACGQHTLGVTGVVGPGFELLSCSFSYLLL